MTNLTEWHREIYIPHTKRIHHRQNVKKRAWSISDAPEYQMHLYVINMKHVKHVKHVKRVKNTKNVKKSAPQHVI